MAVSGRRLDDLERRPDGVRGGVHRAADHPVGHPQMHHHRAEIGDVADDLGGAFLRHPLVRAQPGVFLGEPVDQFGVLRGQDGGPGDVHTDRGCLGAHHRFLAEQGEVGDTQPQQAVRRPQDPLVVALGQHHVSAVGPGPGDQPVLEHQRGDHLGLGDVDRVQDGLAVHRVGEHPQRRLQLDPGRSGQRAVHPGQRRCRLERSDRRDQDRQVLLHPVDEVGDRLRWQVAAGEQNRGQVRERPGLVRQDQRRQQIGPVARRDHRVVLLQTGQHVRQRHRGHQQPHRFALQPFRVPADQLGAARPLQVGDGRGDQQRDLRDRADRQAGLGQQRPGPSRRRPGSPGWRPRRPVGRVRRPARCRPARPSTRSAPASCPGRAPPAPPVSPGWPRWSRWRTTRCRSSRRCSRCPPPRGRRSAPSARRSGRRSCDNAASKSACRAW